MSYPNDIVPGTRRLHLPQRLVPIVFALLMSGLVSCIVSGVITVDHTGLDAGFPLRWLRVWLLAWIAAFPCVAFFGPRIHRIIDRFSA